MKSHYLPILIIISLFLFITSLLVSPYFFPSLSVIQQEKPIAGSAVTVGDLIILVTLFGTIFPIGLWVASVSEKSRLLDYVGEKRK